MKKVIMLFLCVVAATSASAPTLPFSKEFNDNGDFITAQGMWRVETPNKNTETVLGDVEIECYKTGGTALVGTASYCMQAVASVFNNIPSVEVDYYPVLSWSKDRVIAADSSTARFPICIWTQITLDRQNKTVIATDTRKPGRKGLDNSCDLLPQSQTYYLLDKTSEIIRRGVMK